ncbi:MAG: AGE family epimerase/isomerase [Lentisphaeria bacterium]|nr:AGE family epimerase/isomerase [Lentisphaeria bacterium]
MPEKYLAITEAYLRERLLPFWTARAPEPVYGGFRTQYDRHGKPTAVTDKTLLCQARCLVTFARAQRLGWEWPEAREMLSAGVAFLEKAFRDPEHDGYVWVTAADGRWLDDRKVMYGLSFLIYAYSELALLTDSEPYRRRAGALFDLVAARAADFRHGGFFEHFRRDFALESVRPDGLLHKSLDVHMHLLEAFTTLAECTGSPRHRQALRQVTDLIFERMLDPETGTGMAMFAPDWRPIPNLPLGTLWGSDRFEPEGKPPEITSYGHNIELAWLYLHSLRILGEAPASGLPRTEPIFRHTLTHGVDTVHGGLFTEGHRRQGPTETNKEFWQQAEALVGFLDAYELTGDKAYWDAFRNVHRFVFEHMIHWEQGEWYPLLARDGTVLWDYMGHNWKTCYHTIRAMCEVVLRLRRLCRRA